MRVLYLTNLPAPYRMAFFQELGKLCELTVLVETERAADRNEKWYVENNNRSFRYVQMRGIRWGKDSAFSPSVLWRLKKKSFDIIVLGGYSSPTEILAILYMRLRKLPFVASADGGFTASREMALKKSFKKFLVQSAQQWLVSGNGTREYLEHYGADPEYSYFYPFTSLEEKDILRVPPADSEKDYYKRALGINGLLVISVGQFIRRKGFDILLRAWERLRCENATLAIIGGGPQQSEYIELAKSLELKNVKILDFMKKDELLAWYRAADIFVMPTRYDIWGLVVNEAMAQGLPVITTNGAMAGLELVHDGENGFIIPVEDTGQLAACIKRLLTDNELRRSMALRSSAIIRPYSIANMARVYLQAFEAILAGKGANEAPDIKE